MRVHVCSGEHAVTPVHPIAMGREPCGCAVGAPGLVGQLCRLPAWPSLQILPLCFSDGPWDLTHK